VNCKNCNDKLQNYADLKKRGYCLKTECKVAYRFRNEKKPKMSQQEARLEKLRKEGIIL